MQHNIKFLLQKEAYTVKLAKIRISRDQVKKNRFWTVETRQFQS